MFALIITIISIALVAALALATIYYGGTAFNRGTAEAKASQLINEGQQINGAVALAQADIDRDGLTTVVDAALLVSGNYLAQFPAGWTLADATGAAQTGTAKAAYAVHSATGVGAAALEQISKKAGIALVGGQADGVLADSEVATDSAAAPVTTLATTPVQVYGVVGTGAAPVSVFYKV